MNQLEQRGRKRRKKRNLKYALLTAVKLTAIAGLALAAPNVPQSLHKLGLLPQMSNDTSVIKRARRKLLGQGLLSERDGLLNLTAKGSAVLSILEAAEGLKKQRRWDGRWRVLIFDIPEYRKGVRDKIRRTLIHVGFVRLQDSVWAYPYDCEDLIVLLKADFKIGKDVLYMIVDELEGDYLLRKHFGFKKHQ